MCKAVVDGQRLALVQVGTKWIHLHLGDAGMKELLRQVHQLLLPGRVFIPEPQRWASYRREAVVLETCVLCRLALWCMAPVPACFLQCTGQHLRAIARALPSKDLTHIKLRPEQFVDHLTIKLGFILDEVSVVVKLQKGLTSQHLYTSRYRTVTNICA